MNNIRVVILCVISFYACSVRLIIVDVGFEFQNEIAPNEDHDISKELGKILKKKGINILTNSEVVSSKIVDNKVKVDIESNDKKFTIDCDVVLSAVGIKSNIENIPINVYRK